MSERKTTDRDEAEITEEVGWFIKNYILDNQKMQEAQCRIAEAVGPMKAIEANVWIFIMENFVKTLKQTSGYIPHAVSILEKTYRVECTVFNGTTEECRDMSDRLFQREKPYE